jgi:hypothetical protein
MAYLKNQASNGLDCFTSAMVIEVSDIKTLNKEIKSKR